MMRALAALAVLGACSNETGTLSLSLVTAPDSHVLDPAMTLRLTLTAPHEVTEAPRGAAGFDLALDLPASGGDARVIVEALDAGGTVIAVGESPQFPVAAINAAIVIYMAAPMSIAAAPATLAPARSGVAAGALTYGVVLAGGRDATGATSDAIAIYNAYDHTLVAGLALPAPRDGLALGVGANDAVYLFGGGDAAHAPTATAWRFDTTVAPNGAYTTIAGDASLVRTAQLAVPQGSDQFIVTGAPVVELGLSGFAARTDLASLPAVGASVTPSDGIPAAVFAGNPMVRVRGTTVDQLSAASPAGATIAALPGGRLVVIGGTRDALLVDGSTGTVTTMTGVLAAPRMSPSVVATGRNLIVADGLDAAGMPIATAEVFDATTLAPLATLVTAARGAPVAIALPDEQILLAGDGLDAIELFTPDAPP